MNSIPTLILMGTKIGMVMIKRRILSKYSLATFIPSGVKKNAVTPRKCDKNREATSISIPPTAK